MVYFAGNADHQYGKADDTVPNIIDRRPPDSFASSSPAAEAADGLQDARDHGGGDDDVSTTSTMVFYASIGGSLAAIVIMATVVVVCYLAASTSGPHSAAAAGDKYYASANGLETTSLLNI